MSLILAKEERKYGKVFLVASIFLFVDCLLSWIYLRANALMFIVFAFSGVSFWSYCMGLYLVLVDLRRKYVDLMTGTK
jgi:hypothetical protein